MTRTTRAPLRRSSVVWHVVTLAAAWLWAGAVVTFYYSYHFAQPSSPWATYNGRSYYTHPPAETLAQGDHVSAEIVTIALGLAVFMGTLDLTVRLARRMPVLGVAATLAGGQLMLFSLFGLLRGLVGIGTAGLLVALSGVPVKSTAPAAPEPPTSADGPARWCADPTGRYELRYWDGTSWSAHVSTAGHGEVDHL